MSNPTSEKNIVDYFSLILQGTIKSIHWPVGIFSLFRSIMTKGTQRNAHKLLLPYS